MRVPYSWMADYCDPGLEPRELAEKMAMTGTEVERVVTLGPPSAEGFFIGKVVSVEKHPDADRLNVCKVETGHEEDGEPRTIVDLLVGSELVDSRGNARRAIKEGGAYVNNERIASEEWEPAEGDLLHGSWLVLRRGKKNFAGVKVTA